MSNDAERKNAGRDSAEFDLTGGEFALFLHEKCQNMKCPACGSEEPPMIEADSAEGPAHMSSSPIVRPPNYGFKGYCSALCQACGYRWTFSAVFVLDWALEKRNEETHSEG